MKSIKYCFSLENDYKVDLYYPNQLSKQVIVQIVLPLNTSLLIVQMTKNHVLNELFALIENTSN